MEMRACLARALWGWEDFSWGVRLGFQPLLPSPQGGKWLILSVPLFSHLQMGMVAMDLPYRTAGKMK